MLTKEEKEDYTLVNKSESVQNNRLTETYKELYNLDNKINP